MKESPSAYGGIAAVLVLGLGLLTDLPRDTYQRSADGCHAGSGSGAVIDSGGADWPFATSTSGLLARRRWSLRFGTGPRVTAIVVFLPLRDALGCRFGSFSAGRPR